MAYLPQINTARSVSMTSISHSRSALLATRYSGLHSRTTAPTPSATSQQGHILNPSYIAGITVGVLVTSVLVFFAVGTLVNYFHVRRRAKRNQRIEAQHRRWPSSESRYPPLVVAMSGGRYYVPDNEANAGMAARQHYIPNIDKNAPLAHLNTQHAGAPSQPDLEKIGIAVSPEVGTMESPESYHSDSSVSNLLSSNYSKALPPPPPSVSPGRPESNYTVFEDFRQSYAPATHQIPAAYTRPTAPTRASSLRPRQNVPARLKIPTDPSSPPPIAIYSPSKTEPSLVVNPRPMGPNRDDSQGSSSRSNSSSPPPPSYAAFPAPPAAQRPEPKPAQLEQPRRNGSRKDTPSYLPAYYTSPTPPAPVPPRMAVQGSFSANPAVQSNATVTTPNTAALELEPSSASSNGSDTSFESVLSQDATPPENQSKHTAPILTGPESPLKDLRYPKIPRPSNQSIPRTPPAGIKAKPSRDITNTSNEMTKSGSNASLLEKRRGQEAATKLEQKLWITESNVRQPQFAKSVSQGQQQWPQRNSSKREVPRGSASQGSASQGSASQGPAREPRWESKLTPRMKNGDMILEISSP